jgi:hypothetical protein
VKPRENIASLAVLALAAWAGCTQGTSHYQVTVEGGRPHDGPATVLDVGGGGGSGGSLGEDAAPYPDADDRIDVASGPDTVMVDASAPADSTSPADVAPQVDSGPPADTIGPIDTVAPIDTADAGPAADTAAPLVNGVRGVYYSGRNHNTFAFERIDQLINFSWMHDAPDPRLPVDDFSVRWFGRLQPRYTERYTLSIVSDDGARLMINGQYVIDKWTSQSSFENKYQIDLVANQLYDIQVEFYDGQLTALVRFYWTSPSQVKEIVPYSRLFTR